MKKILILVTLLLLQSCWEEKIIDTNTSTWSVAVEEVAKISDEKMNENVSTWNSAEDIEAIKQADDESSSLDTWYNSISTINWVELFQNNSKDVSIIDVDLEYAWVSFGWLVQDEKFYKKYSAKEMEELANRPDNIFWVVNGSIFLM